MSDDILDISQYKKYHENNIKNVLDYIHSYSGNAEMDKKKVDNWIQKQPTDESKQAAKDIIKHTKYFSLLEVFKEIHTLIDKNYRNLITEAKSDNTKIVMFIGQKNKSNDFLSMIAYHHMSALKLEIPHQYIRRILDKFLDSQKFKILYLDDMAYSGGQTSGMLDQIYSKKLNECMIEYIQEQNSLPNVLPFPKKHLETLVTKYVFKGKLPKEMTEIAKNIIEEVSKKRENELQIPIYFMFIGVNKVSLNRLKTRNYVLNDVSNASRRFFWALPESITLQNIHKPPIIYNTLFPTLDELLPERQLFNLGYFFSFGLIPNVSIYFDHKIADEPSTFSRVFSLGPIVPKNYCIFNYLNSKILDKNYLDELFKGNDVVSKRFSDNFKDHYDQILKDRTPQNIREPLEFSPFLKTCAGVQKLIKHPYMKYLNYLELINGITDTTFLGSEIFYKLDFDQNDNFNPKLNGFEWLDENLDEKSLNNYRRRSIDKKTYIKIENFLIRIREDRCHITMYKNDYNHKTSLDVKSIEGSKSFISDSLNKSLSKSRTAKSVGSIRNSSSAKTRKSRMSFKAASL